MEDRLAEFLARHEFRTLRVEDHAVDVVDGAAHDVNATVLREGLHLVGRHFGDEVEFARAQTRDAGGEFRNFHEAHASGGSGLRPIAVVANELEAVARLEVDDLVGTRADRLANPVFPAARGLPTVFGDDFGGARRETAFDDRIGRLHGDSHRVVVDLRHFFEVPEEFPRHGATRSLFAREAFGAEREDDVVGREVRAVMELDAVTELEFDRFGRDTLPGFGEPRLQFARRVVGLQEGFEDGRQVAVDRVVVQALRLDHGRQLGHGDHHVVGPGKSGDGSGRERRGDDRTDSKHERETPRGPSVFLTRVRVRFGERSKSPSEDPYEGRRIPSARFLFFRAVRRGLRGASSVVPRTDRNIPERRVRAGVVSFVTTRAPSVGLGKHSPPRI